MKRWVAVLAAIGLGAGCSTLDTADDPEPRLTPLEDWGGMLEENCAPYWQAALESCAPAEECPQGMVNVCDYMVTMPMGCGGWHSGCGMDGQMAPTECCSAQVCANCRCDSAGEVCGNLLDDDHDGATDEDCPAVLKYIPDLPGMGKSGGGGTPGTVLPLKVPHGVQLPMPKVPGGSN